MTNLTDDHQAVIDADELTVRRTIHIAAPVEKVWTAVTEPEHISTWFGRAEFTGSGVGASGTLTFPDNPPVPIRVEAMDPPRTVSYRWGNDAASGSTATEVDDHSTVFTFTLEPQADGTRLTVVESGFEHTSDPAANLEDHRGGWNSELDKLVAVVEAAG